MRQYKYYFLLYFLPILIWANNNIKEYNIDIKLLQSGQVEIVHEIVYFFDTPQKGITLEIPHTFKLGIYTKDIKIKNISILRDGRVEKYIKDTKNPKYIKISTGIKEKKLKGYHTFNIFYTITKGVSNYDNKFDITKLDIINNFNLNIKKMNINIILPYSLSNKNTLIKVDKSSIIKWNTSHEIQIKISNLRDRNSKRIEIIYPINILGQNGKTNFSMGVKEQIFTTWNWFALFLISIFSYKYWLLLGFDKFNKTIYSKYKQPSKLDILQSGLLYNKFVDNSNFIVAIIELAQKGYIDITKYNKSTPATLYKIDKDTKGLSYEMRYLLDNILFPIERVVNIQKHSKSEASRFLKGYKVITELLYAWSYREKYMQNNPKRERKIFLIKILTISIPLIIFSIYSSINLLGVKLTSISILHSIFIIAFIILIVNGRIITKILSMISIFIISILLSKYYIDIGLNNIRYTPLILIIITYMIIHYIYNKIGRYTRKGSIAKAYLDKIKKFINNADIKDIRKKLIKDPLYLDKLLPYAMLFNHTKKWVSFYHRLGVDTPKWYMGSEIYTIKYFYQDMEDVITIYQTGAKKTIKKGNKK